MSAEGGDGIDERSSEISRRIHKIPADKSDLGIIVDIGLMPGHERVYNGAELTNVFQRLQHAEESGLITTIDSGTYGNTSWHYRTYILTPKGRQHLNEVVMMYGNLVAKENRKASETEVTKPN